ncbi:MAG: DNA repair protein RadA [Polyangiales bacterium]
MSAKSKLVYACAECGAASPRWHGRCPTCGAWNSLHEEVHREVGKKGGVGKSAPVRAAKSLALGEVVADGGGERWPTGIAELDRVLGGGFVRGGVVLLGGDPGVGKSTLLLQALAALAKDGVPVLYATGEESASQVALRARRLAPDGVDSVRVLASTELDDVVRSVEEDKPCVVVVDSVQTLRSSGLESSPGTVSQLREVSARLIDLAKRTNVALVLVGHVTKDGGLAGPKVLEHLVDAVLAFEGEREHAFRVLRASKNRFGPASEVGVFEMAQDGLVEVPDPSAMFLRERPRDAAGSVVVPLLEGTRPVLVEVQALVAPAVYGAARRVTSGVDTNRVAILLAVLDRKVGLHVLDQDVFVSTAGGVRAPERALDLGVALAIVSSFRQRPVPPTLGAFGEVGLAGELRTVGRPGARVRELAKFGYTRVVLPRTALEQLTAEERKLVDPVAAATLAEAIESALE